jgi:AcrR family transcriptional regulator
MPRHPDPDLEDRILHAAQVLWKRGGDKSLTMRAVARAAGTNTPAVYRRFKDRRDLLRALIRRIQEDVREHLKAGESIEGMAEAYVEYALQHPREYDLFYTHARELSPEKGSGRLQPIRESRPNVGLVEERLAKRLGGSPLDHTRLALALWATVHGTTTMLLAQAIPKGHEEELRSACRAAIKTLLEGADRFPERPVVKRGGRLQKE